MHKFTSNFKAVVFRSLSYHLNIDPTLTFSSISNLYNNKNDGRYDIIMQKMASAKQHPINLDKIPFWFDFHNNKTFFMASNNQVGNTHIFEIFGLLSIPLKTVSLHSNVRFCYSLFESFFK